MNLNGQVIIVTGAASGMGRATASLLANAGAHVVVADIDEAAGSKVAESIGPLATLDVTDLRSIESIESTVSRAVERFGKIDGLANVAAIFPYTPFLETTPEVWEQIDSINLRGSFFMALRVAQSMIQAGTAGAIVNVASGAAYRPVPGMAAYSATKGGVVAMSRTMAHELAPHHIRVNVVAPGHTASETIRESRDPSIMEAAVAGLMNPRWMYPEEVAEAIVFLLSDASRAMTGAAINVNNGNYMPH